MKKIVMITHGEWGKSFINDLKEYFGVVDDIQCYCIFKDTDIDSLLELISNELSNDLPSTEYIFISDLEGSSSYRMSILLALKYKGKAYTNLSSSLVLKIVNEQNCDGELEKIELINKFNNQKEERKMETIKFARVDHRLIHGQVITKWLKIYPSDIILIIDDNLSKDSFMGDIYRMAAPGGTEVKILSVEDSAKYIESLEETTKLFVLFKNLKSVQKLVDLGIKIDHLQLGGIPYEDGRKKVASAVSLLNEELAFLEQLSDSHTEVYIQIIPEESKLSMDEIKKNF